MCHHLPVPLQGPNQPLWSSKLGPASLALPLPGNPLPQLSPQGVTASLGVDGLSRPLPGLSSPAQVRHRPCSRCPGRSWGLICILPELPGGLASSLHLALVFLLKAQEGAQSVVGKFCDSEPGPTKLQSLLCEAMLLSIFCPRGRH